MRGGTMGRRATLLGGAGLLAGCDSLDGILGSRKRPLQGERRAVLRADPPLVADRGTEGRPIILPAGQPSGDWPQAGGPPSHAPGHIAFAGELRRAWTASFGYGSAYRRRLTAGPVSAGGLVVVVDAYATVSAFDLETGARRWERETTPEAEGSATVAGGAGFEGGTLYVATGFGELLALDPADGAVRWRVRLPAPTRGAPTIAGGRVFIPTVENQLLALSASDGQRLWTHRAQPITTLPLGLPAPAVEGDAVVAGFANGELTALRATDGRVLWAEALGGLVGVSLSDITGITALPVVDRGRVFATGLANTTLAVDLRSGRRLWERSFGGRVAPAAAGDWLFWLTSNGEALAMGRDDGRIRWVADLDPPPDEGRRRPPVPVAPPLLLGGRLVVATARGEVLGLVPQDGELAFRLPISPPVSLPGAVARGTLLYAGDDGSLIALRPVA